MVTILLLGELGKRFGRRHKMAVVSAAEAVRALCANFPCFERELVASGERGVGYRVLAGRDALSASPSRRSSRAPVAMAWVRSSWALP
jgi:predicted phage tail protein